MSRLPTDIGRKGGYRVFLGEYTHTLDAKGRLTIPARMREELGDGLVLTRGHDPCLTIFPRPLWEEISRRAAEMPTTSAAARAFNRQFFSRAFEVVPDQMGRILIPAPLREYANIREEAIIVGANAYIEIWSPERWAAQSQRDHENMAHILEELNKAGYHL